MLYGKVLNSTVPHLGIESRLSSLGSKSEVSPTLYDAKLNELLFDYDGCTRIFAVGSTIVETAGAAAVLAHHSCNKRLPKHSSIFTAEIRAIVLALEMAQRRDSTVGE